MMLKELLLQFGQSVYTWKCTLESLTETKQKLARGYYYYCFNKHLQQTYQSSLKKKI